jgi:hypothetical protein
VTNVGVKMRFETDNGFVEYLEFQDTVWVMNMQAKRKGLGPRLMREALAKARSLGKTVYGKADRQSKGMNNRRLYRWYLHNGFEPIQMADNPLAIRMGF